MTEIRPQQAALRRITLLTDFGTADGYVAAMRGVLASLAPHTLVEDATHEIAPGDVSSGAWVLSRYWRLYPEGTIHVVVVDPGVGGERRPLALESCERFIVAPDNGVITRILDECPSTCLVEIDNQAVMRHPVSSTFHGRDVFAPAAAYLAGGGHLDALGSRLADPIRLSLGQPRREGGTVVGEVIHVDRFGNLITNIPRDWVLGSTDVLVEDKPVGPLRSTYADVASGDRLALIGSADLLEVSVRDGSASETLDSTRGARVVVRFRP